MGESLILISLDVCLETMCSMYMFSTGISSCLPNKLFYISICVYMQDRH